MEAKTRPTERRLDTAVLRDTEDFAALEEEWAELYGRCPSATPFQSWAWLYSWWEHYGGDYELRLIAVREGDLLVGLAPLMLRRGPGFGRLLLVGTGSTDYLDVLAREGWEREVAEAGARALEGMDGWRVADLQELRPGAVAWALHRGWSGSKIRIWQNNCVMTDLKPWDEQLGSLSKNLRKMARRSIRRMEGDGVCPGLVAAEGAEVAARRLVALHRESWQGRGIGLEHTTRRFEALLEAAIRRMTARGLGAISEFRRDDAVVISNFFVFGRDFVGHYMTGANREARDRYQVSSLSIWDALNIARSKNVPCLNHLRGEEPYKLQWSSRTVPNHRLILARNPVVLTSYTRYHLTRSKVEKYVLSESAPRWIRKIVARYRALRLKRPGMSKGYQSD